MSTTKLPTLLTPAEAGKILGRSEHVLKQWRYLKRGPNWVKLGNRVMYAVEDVQAFIDAGRVDLKASA